jgi:RNA polymerase primary sigma factor
MANPNRVSKEEVMSNAVLVTEVHPRSHAHGARPKSFRAPDRLSVDSLGGYLRSIGRYEILTAEEEGALATRIEVGLLARERLENAQSVDVERLDEQALRDLRELVADGEAAHRDFFLANLKLVVSIAKQYARQGAPMLDLIQDGNIGLDRAIKKFDHALGFKFSTYAVWWIRQAITRGLAETGHLIRVPVHTAEKIQKLRRIGADLDSALGRRAAPEELARESQLSLEEVRQLLDIDRDGVSLQLPLNTDDSEGELGDLIEDDDAPTIIELVTMTLRAERLRAEVARLPRRQARLLSMRYGLGGESPMSFEQVGTRMGISRERARQLEARALAALRCSDLE